MAVFSGLPGNKAMTLKTVTTSTSHEILNAGFQKVCEGECQSVILVTFTRPNHDTENVSLMASSFLSGRSLHLISSDIKGSFRDYIFLNKIHC